MQPLTEYQVMELKLAHKHTREKRIADRIKAVLYLHFGLTVTEIARLLLFDEVTIRRYGDMYRKAGLSGLMEYRYTGGSSRLTRIQEQDLKTFLTATTALTALSVVDHINTVYHHQYSVIGVTKLLHRLGFVYKKPKVIPGSVDRHKQETFLKTYQATKARLRTSDHLYFLDATHPQHNTRLAYGWILRGKKNDKFIKTNSGRARLNLHGALRLGDNHAVVLEEEAINQQATIRLLQAIGKQQRRGIIYLVLDNASYYHGKLVKAWVSSHARFRLLFLPAYSPNLNLIERLWRFFHQQITYNRYFKTFDEFKTTTLDFFKNLKQYEKELATLLTDNFQLYPT